MEHFFIFFCISLIVFVKLNLPLQVLSYFRYDLIVTPHYSSRRGTREIFRFSRPWHSVKFNDICYLMFPFYCPTRYVHVKKRISYFGAENFLRDFENGLNWAQATATFFVSHLAAEATKLV